jgi:hypothetical protein
MQSSNEILMVMSVSSFTGPVVEGMSSDLWMAALVT